VASHLRTLIRNAIALRLHDRPALSGITIFATRSWAETETELPYILIQTLSETIESYDRLPTNNLTFLTRTLEISLICAVKALDTATVQLDSLTAHIEDALESFEIPGLESADVRLQSTKLDLDTSGSQPIALADMTYHVLYNRPYRVVSDPYVDWDTGVFNQSGWYPGGRITEGAEPPAHTGVECPTEVSEGLATPDRKNTIYIDAHRP